MARKQNIKVPVEGHPGVYAVKGFGKRGRTTKSPRRIKDILSEPLSRPGSVGASITVVPGRVAALPVTDFRPPHELDRTLMIIVETSTFLKCSRLDSDENSAAYKMLYTGMPVWRGGIVFENTRPVDREPADDLLLSEG